MAGSLLGAAFLFATSAHATVIDFDSLNNGDIVTNQFPEATFSSNPGFELQVTAQNLGSSLPNFICTAVVASGIDCVQDVFVAFTNPVSGLTFLGTGVNNAGVVALVDIFVNGSLAATLDVVGFANPFAPVLVDASAFSNVTGITIRNVTDLAGIGWDDFTFETNTGAVPEPGTWALMGLGLTALALRRRR
jgi:hypothetical protein